MKQLVLAVALVVAACATTAESPPNAQPPASPPTPTDAAIRSTTSTAPPPTTAPSSTTSTTTTPTTPTTVPPPTVLPPAVTEPCSPISEDPPVLTGTPIERSRALLALLVCAATDVVVTAKPDPAALASGLALGAPVVLASEEEPFDASAVGAIRVWTVSPSLVASTPDVAVFPLPDLADMEPVTSSAVVADFLADGEPSPQDVAQAIEPAPMMVLVDTDYPFAGAAMAATAAAVGVDTAWMPAGDGRRRGYLRETLTETEGRIIVGRHRSSVHWQLDVMVAGTQLPGGGQTLFPDRRFVALYGHPHSSALGALGEQPVDQAVERAIAVAAEYAIDDVATIPAFEIIATVATAGAGPDGDYSGEIDLESLTEWVNAATDAGLYVVIDLQPGRTDFLTQAKLYEEVLVRPNVGLALDPEWRLGSNQRHLQQIGTVTAAEVNSVTEWLAGLVRDHLLPQKLLIVHQFKSTMIQDRSDLASPSELVVVIQMDGQGGQAVKLDTWRALTAEDGVWQWGWKNFYDEDPTVATPSYVLDLEPQPVFVSFQ